MNKCERCGGTDTYTDASGQTRTSDLLDYCLYCSKDLCKKCMAKGCCGHIPAVSGMEENDEDDV